jgi:tetratricopeptide (TPR) repeat protein
MTGVRTLIFLFAMALAALAQMPPQSREVVIIEGMVRNAAGEAVANATVVLEQKDQPKPTETTTNNGGAFGFAPEHPGIFKITAKKAGFHDAVVEGLALSPGEKKRVNLVLEAPGSTTMEFEDKPDFTVAGVTDYTAAGGHGADTSLRTSETLARETLALKESKAQSQADVLTENKLRGVLRPGSFEANYQLGKFYLASGRYAEAVPLLETACKLRPGDFSSGYDLALGYKSAGNLEKARQQAEKMLAGSKRADLHRLLGDIAERAGDSLRGVREYEAAARLEPSEQNYFDWGAELLLHRAILPAIEVFGKGNAAHPKSARMLAGLGAALYASGRYEEAASRICAAADLKPSDELPYLFLGKMEKATQAPLPCGDEKLARFARDEPDNAMANYYYAVALSKRGEADQSQSLFNKAVTLDPKCGDAYVQLGALHAARGEMPAAIEAYQKAIAVSPELGEAHYRLGQAYKRSGDEAHAEQELAAYAQVEKTQTAEVERQRHELQQFLVVLKGEQR